MATIDVRLQDENKEQYVFHVRVQEDDSTSKHVVRMQRVEFEQLAGGACEPAEFIEEAFTFLLERESKESILSRFDINDISKYFPDFNDVIRERVTQM